MLSTGWECRYWPMPIISKCHQSALGIIGLSIALTVLLLKNKGDVYSLRFSCGSIIYLKWYSKYLRQHICINESSLWPLVINANSGKLCQIRTIRHYELASNTKKEENLDTALLLCLTIFTSCYSEASPSTSGSKLSEMEILTLKSASRQVCYLIT